MVESVAGQGAILLFIFQQPDWQFPISSLKESLSLPVRSSVKKGVSW